MFLASRTDLETRILGECVGGVCVSDNQLTATKDQQLEIGRAVKYSQWMMKEE